MGQELTEQAKAALQFVRMSIAESMDYAAVQQVFIVDGQNDLDGAINHASRRTFIKEIFNYVGDLKASGFKLEICDLSDWRDWMKNPEDLPEAINRRLFPNSRDDLEANIKRSSDERRLNIVVIQDMDEMMSRFFYDKHNQRRLRHWFYDCSFKETFIPTVMIVPISKRRIDACCDHEIFQAGFTDYMSGSPKDA